MIVLTRDNNIPDPAPAKAKDAPPGAGELAMLIQDCIAQSRTGQKKLYDKYAPAAYGVIKRYMYYDEQGAREVLNDAFFKIFTRLDQYSFQGAFEGWIRRIVVNTVTDHLRKNMKHAAHKELAADDAEVSVEATDNLSHKELLAMVAALPDTQRLVFNLFVFESYAHKEIAELLGLTENNCRWHLNDARRRLKEKINAIVK